MTRFLPKLTCPLCPLGAAQCLADADAKVAIRCASCTNLVVSRRAYPRVEAMSPIRRARISRLARVAPPGHRLWITTPSEHRRFDVVKLEFKPDSALVVRG